jgi:hypothetical protein
MITWYAVPGSHGAKHLPDWGFNDRAHATRCGRSIRDMRPDPPTSIGRCCGVCLDSAVAAKLIGPLLLDSWRRDRDEVAS